MLHTSTEEIINILAELHAENQALVSVTPCGSDKCKLCFNISPTSFFFSTVSKKRYEISEYMNCNTRNVIYLVTCLKCKLQYVGETKRTLRERFNNHRSDIHLSKHTAIGIHFNNILHSYNNILDGFLALVNLWGRAFQKLYPVYHSCLAAGRLKKFHEDAPISREVIEPNTLNFRPNFKFSRLKFFLGTLVPLGGMR